MDPLRIWEKNMETGNEKKQEIRKEIAALRASLPDQKKVCWDKALKERLFAMEEFSFPSRVFCYIDIRKEAGTREILKELWDRNIPVAAPKVLGETIAFSLIKGLEETKAGAMGILEPKSSDYLLPEDGDVILVPALALDYQGRRVGYGGGYYDRFLGRLKGRNCLKIGLIYDFQLFPQVPAQAHDCILDRIVTPTQTIICRRK